MIKAIRNLIVAGENALSVTHIGRTVLAAVLSLLVAQLIRLPEAYWAGITTLAVIQSTSEAALPIAVQYFAGTALGAAVGGWAGAHFPVSIRKHNAGGYYASALP